MLPQLQPEEPIDLGSKKAIAHSATCTRFHSEQSFSYGVNNDGDTVLIEKRVNSCDCLEKALSLISIEIFLAPQTRPLFF